MGVSIHYKLDPVLEIFDFLGMPAFLINHNQAIASLNATASDVFRYAQDDFIGHDICTVIALYPDLVREFLQSARSVSSVRLAGQKQEGDHLETLSRRKNGETFPSRVSLIPSPWEDQRIVIVQDLTSQKKLQQRASRRAKELSIFNTFSKILAKHTDTGRIMEETIHMLLYLMEAEQGWISLMNDTAGELTLTVHQGISQPVVKAVSHLKPGECFAGKVLTSGRALLVEKASEDPRVMHRDPSIESMVGLPIVSKGTLLGVLGLGSRRVAHFTSLDIQLLTTIASELGVAIENANLIQQLREKMKEIELINELSSVINSSLSIGTVFRIMMSEIRKIIDYDRGSILLYNEQENNLLIFALDTDMKTTLKKGVRAPLNGTSAGWVIKHNMPWINHDLGKEIPFPLDRKLHDEGIRSTISIPLAQDKVLGVFNLDSREPFRYSEKDIRILLSVSKHISIALENALLFEEISREKKEWERTFDAITDMVWIEDGKQIVLRANQALLSRTGFSLVEITGKHCTEVLDRIGLVSGECFCEDTLAAKKTSFLEVKGKGGNIYHFWAYPLMDDEGQVYAIVHYLQDVTAQKRLEQQLVRADKLASLGTLVAGIAHEINNPLGIIAGYSEALLDRAQNRSLLSLKAFEDFPEYLETIHNEMFRCKGILGSLLEFSRPYGGIFRDLDINELIKEVILLVNHRAAKLNHNITLDLNRDLPKIYADPGSLRQLFMNIIMNSLYFTPSGGTITIRTGIDEKESFKTGSGLITISVTDSGPGIPGTVIDKIFDPFFTTKPVGEGTGLGLSICHRIVEEHHGTIDVESTPGKGASFIIRLPAKAP